MYEEPVIRRARGPLADVITGLLRQNPAQRLTAAQTRARLGSPSERTVVIEPVTTYVTPQPTREAFEEPRKRRTGLIARGGRGCRGGRAGHVPRRASR
ncbi:hypothetical protein [Lentzea sp. NPDC004782]|uniref:hypothetical protein n=1 Tax=Lentzea sp. NPDC004782 TaxID=3154458 RepID=UPI0033A82662